jgi:hypothetical protein
MGYEVCPLICKRLKLTLCITKYHAMRTYWGSGDVAPHILNLGARWRSVVSFTSRSPCAPVEAPDTHWLGV